LIPFAAGILGALLLLHLFEPDLPLAWSFAGLRLVWGSIVPGLAAAAAVTLVGILAWRSPLGRRPFPRVPPTVIAGGSVALWIALVIVGREWPAPDVCPDVMFLPHQLRSDGPGNGRWLLSVPLLQLIYAPFRDVAAAETVLRITNALFSTLSILLTCAIAARLGRSIREVVAVVLLVWTAFGSLQLAFGYVDIYPIVQVIVALYLWASLRYLDGDGRVLWPVLIAALGSCFYIGLILLGPSLLVIAWCSCRRREIDRLAVAVGAAIALVGLATVPPFGAPFAVGAWSERLASVSWRGLNPDRQTLPLGHMLGIRHAGEVLSTLVLLDGVGLALAATLSPRSLRGAYLWSILASGLAFVVAMDPVWGPYSDWDLFSYLTLPISIAGALALVTWSRAQPRLAGLVLGLALATSVVHLMARLNSLHVDFERHIAASPYHIPDVPNGIFKPRVGGRAR
jgi:hypothetical protein